MQRRHKTNSASEFHICKDCSSLIGDKQEATFQVNAHGQIMSATRELAAISNFSVSELKCQTIFDVTTDISEALWSGYWQVVQASGRIDFNCHLKSKDGSLIKAGASVVIDPDNRSQLKISIKPRVYLEEEHLHLRRVSYEYDKLLYRTSHDLRAPISTAMGLINLLKKDVTPEQKEYIHLLEDTVGRQQKLMQEINHLALISSTEVNFQKIDIPEFIDNLISSFSENEVDWEFDFKLSSPFYSDPYLLTKVLHPILENALIYTDQEVPCVKMTVHVSQEKVVFTIEDDGIGVNTQLANRIFEMFFRGSEYSKGSGLGLYLSLLTSAKLKGNVVLLPDNNNGTSFQVDIPNISYSEYSRLKV